MSRIRKGFRSLKTKKMSRQLITMLLPLCFITFGMKAQDYPVTVLDGPGLQVDSLSLIPSAKPAVIPMPTFPRFQIMQASSTLLMPAFETKEQRAARINQQTYDAVMLSVDQNLYWHRTPKIPKQWKPVVAVARFFLSNPFAFPEGYVPLMNHSFPFIYAKTPGMAPYDNPYTSDQFPKCIESEYDFATGTYKQVMVDWSEIQNRMSANGIGLSNQPVPSIPVTPADRIIR